MPASARRYPRRWQLPPREPCNVEPGVAAPSLWVSLYFPTDMFARQVLLPTADAHRGCSLPPQLLLYTGNHFAVVRSVRVGIAVFRMNERFQSARLDNTVRRAGQVCRDRVADKNLRFLAFWPNRYGVDSKNQRPGRYISEHGTPTPSIASSNGNRQDVLMRHSVFLSLCLRHDVPSGGSQQHFHVLGRFEHALTTTPTGMDSTGLVSPVSFRCAADPAVAPLLFS